MCPSWPKSTGSVVEELERWNTCGRAGRRKERVEGRKPSWEKEKEVPMEKVEGSVGTWYLVLGHECAHVVTVTVRGVHTHTHTHTHTQCSKQDHFFHV